jgi:DNA invertase Pin-like site-specific DNA recombinase
MMRGGPQGVVYGPPVVCAAGIPQAVPQPVPKVASARNVGRPQVMDDVKTSAARGMAADGRSQREIAAALGVSKTSIGRALQDAT